jgi:hypothetical protein
MKFTSLSVLACIILAPGCDGSTLEEPTLEELYQDAIADAKDADPDEIVDTLVAIDAGNTSLIRDVDDRVLMVTWTSYPGYDELIGQDTELAVEVWVTAGREMQDFCRATGLQGAELSLRLEQLIGLPPDNGKNRVVELWVPDAAMFRPSPDPEITDSVAELDFPLDVPDAHRDWINALQASSYGPDGYPWTRLGYTYDWNPYSSEVGLSEFVITPGSTVGVESVSSTDEYCLQQ